MAWPENTREFLVDGGAKTSVATTGETLVWDLPKTGIYGGVYLKIRPSITGTPSTPSAVGQARLIARVRISANAGINLADFSGEGYHFLIRDFLEDGVDVVPDSTGRAAVASGTGILDMWIPASINGRDPIGLINLQNPDTQLRLEVEIGALTRIANDLTALSCIVHPVYEMFRMPLAKEDRPKFDFVQTFQEEQASVTTGVEHVFNWLRGNTYLSVIQGCTLASTPADSWTTAALRVNQNDYLRPALAPVFYTREFNRFHGRARILGVIPFDLITLSGLGNYGSLRDLLNTAQLTDIQSVILPSATTTLYSMKRQLVYIGEPAK